MSDKPKPDNSTQQGSGKAVAAGKAPKTKGKPPAQKSEASLIEARRGKATAVRSRGHNPFANDVDVSDRSMVGDLRHLFSPAQIENAESGAPRYDAAKVAELAGDRLFHVFGRMMARRGFGKASFLRLRDGSGGMQLFAKKDEMGDAFSALEDIDMADHIEARGQAMVTKTGELSLMVRELRLVTKAMRPLPDKWHGLTDVEARYRRRYVDLVANPDVAVALRARSIIIEGLRDFLSKQGFMEVETPTLHSLVGGAAAHPFETHHNALGLELFLRIAPELYLKRLLVGGFERVFEVGRCYRNEGISTRHNPEFTMLEFYMAYATYETLMPMAERLLRHVDAFLEARFNELGHGEQYRSYKQERAYTLDEPFARVPMQQALSAALEKAGLTYAEVFPRLGEIARPAQADADAEAAGAALVKDWARRNERSRQLDWGNFRKGLSACTNDGERLFLAYEYVAEPFLTEDYRTEDDSKSLPVFIIDYPFEISPLARRKDSDAALTDRFELFIDGRELGNAFSELNDPDDQAARFREQVNKKSAGAEETMDYDEDYVRALEHGMPPAAGFGLGVDRLVMMLAGQSSIRDVIAFPLLRPGAK